MGPDYELVMKSPPVEDYVRLRQQAGLSPKIEEQATAARGVVFRVGVAGRNSAVSG